MWPEIVWQASGSAADGRAPFFSRHRGGVTGLWPEFQYSQFNLRRNKILLSTAEIEAIVFHRDTIRIHDVDEIFFKINALPHGAARGKLLHCRNKAFSTIESRRAGAAGDAGICPWSRAEPQCAEKRVRQQRALDA